MSEESLPAWSEPFTADRRADLEPPMDRSPARTCRSTGATRTAEGSRWRSSILVSTATTRRSAAGWSAACGSSSPPDDGEVIEDPDGGDVLGHGTACAGIIHALAPAAEIVSIRVLGPDNKGKGRAFAHALDWVVEQRIPVANLSLSSRSEALYGTFHDLVDQAYFANCLLVCSASNTPGQESYPSLFSSVVSVAAHDIPDPTTYFYNPRPPVEFGAWGVAVPVAWSRRRFDRGDRQQLRGAPHLGPACAAALDLPRRDPVRGEDAAGVRRVHADARWATGSADISRR